MAVLPYQVKSVTPASGDVITVADLKSFLRVEHDDEDTLLQAAIDAAVEHFEAVSSIQLLSATFDYLLPDWPRGYVIELPRRPVTSVTSVKYVDSASTQITLATTEWTLLTGGIRQAASVIPTYCKTWPSTRAYQVGDVTVRFVAGHSSAADIPAPILSLIRMQAGHLYSTRNPVCCGGGSGTVALALQQFSDMYIPLGVA